jgi:hypothetical protein
MKKKAQPSHASFGGHITPKPTQNRWGWCLFAYGEYSLDWTTPARIISQALVNYWYLVRDLNDLQTQIRGHILVPIAPSLKLICCLRFALGDC